MPAKRRTTKTKTIKKEPVDKTREQDWDEKSIDPLLKEFNAKHKKVTNEFERAFEELLQFEVQSLCESQLTSIAKHVLEITVKDALQHSEASSKMTSIRNNTLKNSTVSSINSTAKRDRRHQKRSLSQGDDGYVTAENSNHSTEYQTTAKKRILPVARSASKHRTPLVTRAGNQFEPVTPKMKPNKPQTIMRWASQGEIAMSMQGSPLMVMPPPGESNANLNIPLEDGRVISVLPHGDLRLSEIPDVGDDTRRQLEVLRQTLNKICAVANRR